MAKEQRDWGQAGKLINWKKELVFLFCLGFVELGRQLLVSLFKNLAQGS